MTRIRMKIKCLSCNEYYNGNLSNTRVYGPIIETTCSNCGKKLVKNYSKFVEVQLEDLPGRLERARLMIEFAQAFSSKFINDNPKKKKR